MNYQRRLSLFDAFSHDVLPGGGLRGKGRVKLYPTHRIESHGTLLVVRANKTPLCLFIVVAAARPQAQAVVMTMVGVLSRMVSAERVPCQIVDDPKILRVCVEARSGYWGRHIGIRPGEPRESKGVLLRAGCCLPILCILKVLEAVDASPTRPDPLARLGGLILSAICTEKE